MTRRYKAFISYSWADRKWGEWLHRSLETYRAPKGVADGRTLQPIFKDREDEAAGVSVGAAIEAALSASEFLIVICSPRSARSAWVNREVAWFKTHKGKGTILALIIDGEPGASATPGREAKECFPKTLTRKVGPDLQPTEEWEDAPLAADARAEGDGKRGAKLKLAAALLGVGLDALIRRDERRRTIRRRFVTGASLTLATVLGGLSIFAFTQRDAAVIARNDAVKARDDAEGIIELILTDLKSDLEGFGTLKSVTAIGNRAIGYYEGQDVKALSPDQLGRRARVLLMLGEADNKRGDLAAALARYETAAATTSEQLARDPENPQRMFDHAQSVFWVGYIAWQRGDRAAAKIQFTEYHDLAQRLVAKDPTNEDWQAELEYAYSNLGTLAMDDGENADAEAYFRKSLELALARLSKAPEDVDNVRAAGQAYAWLADAQYLNFAILEASVTRSREIRLYKAHSSVPQENLVTSQIAMALIRLALNDITNAVIDAEAAAGAALSALDKDPGNASFADRASFAHSVLGETRLHAGDYAGAASALAAASAIADSMLEKDADVMRWRGKLGAQARLTLGATLARRNKREEALLSFASVIEILGEAVNSGAADAIAVRRFCAALAWRARLSTGHEADWIEIIRILTAEGKQPGPEAAALLAEAYQRSGSVGEATPLVGRLYAAGYRHPDFTRFLDEHQDLKAAAESTAR